MEPSDSASRNTAYSKTSQATGVVPPLSTNPRKVKALGVKNEDGDIEPIDVTRREVGPKDIEIALLYCGVCHSDIHHCYNEWKDSMYPMVPGHEMIGRVSKIGPKVTKFGVKDVVAVGNLVNSCRKCRACKNGDEQYCENGGPSWVYNGHERLHGELYPTGAMTFGGYSEMIIVTEDFVLRVPEALHDKLAEATPLLCAGITVYNPLRQNEVVPGMVVGVAGIGGLGHLAVKMAKAMGATVIALTHTDWKASDETIKNLGADDVVLTTDLHRMRAYKGQLDLIIDTISEPHRLEEYLNILHNYGTLWILGVLQSWTTWDLQDTQAPHVQKFSAIANGKKITNFNRHIGGSNVGGIALTQEMLNFCAKNNIVADIELIPPSEIQIAFDRVQDCDIAFRFVLDLAEL